MSASLVLSPALSFAADDRDLRAGELAYVTSGISDYSVSWGGATFVLAWSTPQGIRAARITKNAQVLDPGGVLLVPGSNLGVVGVERSGENVVLVWRSLDEVHYVVLDPDLIPAGSASKITCVSACRTSATASDGTNVAVVWTEQAFPWKVFAAFLGPFETERIEVVSGGFRERMIVSAVARASEFVVVWRTSEEVGARVFTPNDVGAEFPLDERITGITATRDSFLAGNAYGYGTPPIMAWHGSQGAPRRQFELWQDYDSWPLATVFDGRHVVGWTFSYDTDETGAYLIREGEALAFPFPGGGIPLGVRYAVRIASDGEGALIALGFAARDGRMMVHRIHRGDGIPDDSDNCFGWPNPDQADSDGNGIGDACDNGDFDQWRDSEDRCPASASWPVDVDLNKNGIADACDSSFDWDEDGVGNHADNCPETPNPEQLNSDSDALGDACDVDRDGDSLRDVNDNCDLVPNGDQYDGDGDGIGNACDASRDGDGVDDDRDNCPHIANDDQEDVDRDGRGDACDNSTDFIGAGIGEVQDAVPTCALTGSGQGTGSWLLLAPILFWRRLRARRSNVSVCSRCSSSS